MKIAFLFFGELRWFNLSHSNFQEQITPALQGHEVKYFAHFWETEHLKKLPQFQQLYQPLELTTSPSPSYPKIWDHYEMRHRHESNLLPQTYCFELTHQLLKKYQDDNNVHFDIYIKLRTDLFLPGPINFNINNDGLYSQDNTANRPTAYYFNDYLLMSKNYSDIKKLSMLGYGFDKIMDRPAELHYSIPTPVPEEILARHLSLEGVEKKLYSFKVDLARHHSGDGSKSE